MASWQSYQRDKRAREQFIEMIDLTITRTNELLLIFQENMDHAPKVLN